MSRFANEVVSSEGGGVVDAAASAVFCASGTVDACLLAAMEGIAMDGDRAHGVDVGAIELLVVDAIRRFGRGVVESCSSIQFLIAHQERI